MPQREIIVADEGDVGSSRRADGVDDIERADVADGAADLRPGDTRELVVDYIGNGAEQNERHRGADHVPRERCQRPTEPRRLCRFPGCSLEIEHVAAVERDFLRALDGQLPLGRASDALGIEPGP